MIPSARSRCYAWSTPEIEDLFDYCRMVAAPEPLESSLRALAPYIGFITLKDARRTDTGHELLLAWRRGYGLRALFSTVEGTRISGVGGRSRSHLVDDLARAWL